MKTIVFYSKWIKSVFILILILVVSVNFSQAQKKDSLKIKGDSIAVVDTVKKHSPTKALIMSALIPGLGQAYNKKYWKIPIIYVGFGACAYSVSFNHKYYIDYKNAYFNKTDGDSTTIDLYPNYSADVVLQYKNYYRRNLELSYIVGGLIYILNLIDASVDANLFDFDVSDNLALNIQPKYWFEEKQKVNFAGLQLMLTFGNSKNKNKNFKKF
jgi:hypothetical protein